MLIHEVVLTPLNDNTFSLKDKKSDIGTLSNSVYKKQAKKQATLLACAAISIPIFYSCCSGQ